LLLNVVDAVPGPMLATLALFAAAESSRRIPLKSMGVADGTSQRRQQGVTRKHGSRRQNRDLSEPKRANSHLPNGKAKLWPVTVTHFRAVSLQPAPRKWEGRGTGHQLERGVGQWSEHDTNHNQVTSRHEAVFGRSRCCGPTPNGLTLVASEEESCAFALCCFGLQKGSTKMRLHDRFAVRSPSRAFEAERLPRMTTVTMTKERNR